MNTVGFYGKLPIRGDFISRDLPYEFIEHWDDWLQASLHHSQEQLQQQWAESFRSSPSWQFALSEGICAKTGFAGVMLPSHDRIKRHFPLLIGTSLNEPLDLLTLALNWIIWFHQVEQIALLSQDTQLELDTFAAQVRALEIPSRPALLDNPSFVKPKTNIFHPLNSLDDLDSVIPIIKHLLLQDKLLHGSVWWTHGNDHTQPCLLVCNSLPATTQFSSFLVGNWSQWGWRQFEQ